MTVSVMREREREREQKACQVGAFTRRFLGMFGSAEIFAITCYILHKFEKSQHARTVLPAG
jgi:hypothetical protein